MRIVHLLIGTAALAAAAASTAEPSFVPVFRENFPDAFVLSTVGTTITL